MKIYLLVARSEHDERWQDAIRGVFASYELAEAAYPGEYVDVTRGNEVERHTVPGSNAVILEYEVQSTFTITPDNIPPYLADLVRNNDIRGLQRVILADLEAEYGSKVLMSNEVGNGK